MEDIGKHFGTIVEQRLKALNTNAFAVENAAGLPSDAIRNVIRSEKRSGPTLSRVQEICAALGLELYIGLPRDQKEAREPEVPAIDDFAKIPVRNVLVAAGHGAPAQDEAVVSEMAFRRDWLKDLGVAPSAAVMARVSGESMLPTINPGDLILIDTSRNIVPVRQRKKRDRRQAQVYALRDGTGARVKRIERPEEDLVVLFSDNPLFPPEYVRGAQIAELGIVGRVVWWGHTNRE